VYVCTLSPFRAWGPPVNVVLRRGTIIPIQRWWISKERPFVLPNAPRRALYWLFSFSFTTLPEFSFFPHPGERHTLLPQLGE
jgi:hypothetical protein